MRRCRGKRIWSYNLKIREFAVWSSGRKEFQAE
jgi:hypothetical protein